MKNSKDKISEYLTKEREEERPKKFQMNKRMEEEGKN